MIPAFGYSDSPARLGAEPVFTADDTDAFWHVSPVGLFHPFIMSMTLVPSMHD
jgi:hypothetical protein